MWLLLIQIILSSISIDIQNQKQEKTLVYIFLSDECSISKYYMPELNKIHEEFASDKIEFIGVFPNFSSKKNKIVAFSNDYNIQYKTQTDYFKKLSKQYDIKVVPSVLVVKDTGDKIYKGRIDNSYYQIGKRRRVVNSFELKNVLKSITDNKDSKFDDQKAIGCLINYTELK